MIHSLGLLLFSIFAFLGAIHLYWAFGGTWGTTGVFPSKNEHEIPPMPGKVPTLFVAVILLLFGLLILKKSNILSFDIPSWLDAYALRILAGVFMLRAIGDFKYVGFFKKIKHTTFGIKDRKYYTPLCAVMAFLLLVLHVLTA